MIIDECALFEDYRRKGMVFVTPEEDRILQRDKVSWALSLTDEEVAIRLKYARMAQKIRANAVARATKTAPPVPTGDAMTEEKPSTTGLQDKSTTGPQAQGEEK